MSDTQIENPTRERSKNSLVLGAAVGAIVLTSVGVTAVRHNARPQAPSINGPHKEYVVRAYDTEASILQRAYPERDWRTITSIVEDQIPAEDRPDHTVRPGEVLTFGPDADIGKVIEASDGDSSASSG